MTISATTQGLRMGVATSTSRPTVPFDGQVISETDTDSLSVYKGTAWAPVSGLTLITAQTIGTAVSSVTVSSCFSATYDSYKIVANGVGASSNGNVTFQLSGLTTAYYGNLISSNFAGSTPAANGYSNIASITHAAGVDSTSLYLDIDVNNPFLAKPTFIICKYQDNTNSGITTVKQTSSTSATGFVITPASGTLTAGTIRVYGYANL